MILGKEIMDDYEVLRTDVLVIGGGAAGVRAAIEADNQGVAVCLLSKGPVARSGVTPLAYQSLQAAFGASDPRDNPDVHFQDTIVQGRYLSDEDLARILVEESIPRALDLEKFGITFEKRDGKFLQVHHPGQTYPRNLVLVRGGFGLVYGLKRELQRRPRVRILEDFCVSHVLKEHGELVGILGLNMRDGRFYAVAGKSIVLACGGYEELWGNTDTPQDSTGDGVFLGFESGADVIDLEMVQYYPTVFAYPESLKGMLALYETLLERERLDFRLVNGEGEEFLPGGPLPPRDTLVRLIVAEIGEGRGTEHNAVYIDPGRSSKGREEIEKLVHDLLRVPDRNLKKLGIDIRGDRIEVCPAVHYTLGGIHIGEKAETSVPGLFAAGENASNVHGANRISGNALSETQVFGQRAGKFASEHSKGRRHGSLPRGVIREGIEKWDEFMEKKREGIRPLVLRRELKGVMDRYVGPNRSDEGMRNALETVLDLRDNGLPKVEVGGGKIFNTDWRAAIEISMALGLAELVIRAALLRKETRGHHFRADFPETLERPQHTLIRRRGHEVRVMVTPVRKLGS
jgi:succinate dehydrogenase/fumarate reductase flavoprotein subunit